MFDTLHHYYDRIALTEYCFDTPDEFAIHKAISSNFNQCKRPLYYTKKMYVSDWLYVFKHLLNMYRLERAINITYYEPNCYELDSNIDFCNGLVPIFCKVYSITKFQSRVFKAWIQRCIRSRPKPMARFSMYSHYDYIATTEYCAISKDGEFEFHCEIAMHFRQSKKPLYYTKKMCIEDWINVFKNLLYIYRTGREIDITCYASDCSRSDWTMDFRKGILPIYCQLYSITKIQAKVFVAWRERVRKICSKKRIKM
jgi:hypothetical protein